MVESVRTPYWSKLIHQESSGEHVDVGPPPTPTQYVSCRFYRRSIVKTTESTPRTPVRPVKHTRQREKRVGGGRDKRRGWGDTSKRCTDRTRRSVVPSKSHQCEESTVDRKESVRKVLQIHLPSSFEYWVGTFSESW